MRKTWEGSWKKILDSAKYARPSGSCKDRKKYSFWNMFSSKMNSFINCYFLNHIKFLSLISSPHWPLLLSHQPPVTPASFPPADAPANLFLTIFASPSASLFHVLFNLYIIMYLLLFNLLYIYILFSFVIIQLIFNLIFLCIIPPVQGTMDCEKHYICFSSQKGHLRPSLQYIYSSDIFSYSI